MLAFQNRREDGEKCGEAPSEANGGKEDRIRHLTIADNAEPRVECDAHDEESRRDVTDVDEEALTEAPTGGALDFTQLKPMEANDEAESLHHISQGEIVDQDHILVVAHKGAVVLAPSDHTVRDEAEKDDSRQDRDQGEGANCREPTLKEGREVGVDCHAESTREA